MIKFIPFTVEALVTDTRKGTAANWIRPQNCITAFCCSETVNTDVISGCNSDLFLKHQGPVLSTALYSTVYISPLSQHIAQGNKTRQKNN